MSSAAEARDTERRRVKQGLMDGLGRLVVYVDKLPPDETQRWWQIKVKDLAGIPQGIEANLRLPKTVRKTRMELQLGKDGDPFKALIFARVEEGKDSPAFPSTCLPLLNSRVFIYVPAIDLMGFYNGNPGVLGVEASDVDEIFLSQIGKTFDDMMKGKKNNPASRCGVYADLTRVFPEGIFKGFTYPNISAGEDYTLRVLSGKRGETGSISVLETSDSNSSGKGEIDLGSGADTDDEDKDYEESAVKPRGNLEITLLLMEFPFFQSLIPSSQSMGLGKRNPGGTMKSTPRKRRSPRHSQKPSYAPPSANAPRSPQTSPVRTPDTSPGNTIGGESPGIPQRSPRIGLTAREAAAAVGRTVKRPVPGNPGKSPKKHQTQKGKKSAAATSGEICEDPFRGVRPARGCLDKKGKKKVPAKVGLNPRKPLNITNLSLRPTALPGPSQRSRPGAKKEQGRKHSGRRGKCE